MRNYIYGAIRFELFEENMKGYTFLIKNVDWIYLSFS